MASAAVPIRLSYLFRPDLTSSAKLVWLCLRLDKDLPERLLRSPTRIERRVGITRPTIRRALQRLKNRCRPLVPDDVSRLSQLEVRVSPDLITNHALPATARVLYCVLLGLRRLKRRDILSSYSGIARVVGLQPRTVRHAMTALVEHGWLAVSQEHRKAPLRIEFPNPKKARQQAEVRRARQRLEKMKYTGEALALLWCDALVDTKNYEDDFFPSAFTNPHTHELLQADRYYFEHRVVIEFNGPQHDGPTERYSAAEAKAQMERDRLKEEICRRQGITLITLRPEDLTFERLREILGGVLPLQQRTEEEPIIDFLERESRKYRRAMANIRRKDASQPDANGSRQKRRRSA